MILLPNIANLSPNITPLSFADASIFAERFKTQPILYANSFLYVLRATAGQDGSLGMKLSDSDTLIGIGYRKSVLYFVRPIGLTAPDIIFDLARKLYKLHKINIVVKKADAHLTDKLVKTHHFHVPSRQTITLDLEDETFPEKRIDLTDLFKDDCALSDNAKKLQRKVNRFQKYNLDIEVLTKIDNSIHRDLILLVDGSGPKYNAYTNMVNYMLGQKDTENICVFRFSVSGQPQGLYIAQFLNKVEGGLYCALSSMCYKGITEWMDVCFFRYLHSKGMKHILIGGSESKGVDHYVKKLLPSDTPYFSSPLIFSPNSCR